MNAKKKEPETFTNCSLSQDIKDNIWAKNKRRDRPEISTRKFIFAE